MRDCPVCRSNSIVSTVSRGALPVFQNVVWDSPADAIAAPSAPFLLATCRICGFSFNGNFDQSAIVYDERYDNDVPSAAFHTYYQSLVDMLIQRYDLGSGTVYDIGCGKGGFLEMLCAAAPNIQGIGIDPSCEAVQRGNFRLVNDVLRPDHLGADARLVLVRHVLEHIDQPIEFMSMIRDCLPEGVPIFVEVPDLDWILNNNAFWDFCYEHCNYFTKSSLKTALELSGFVVDEQRSSFGDQYQWALCRPGLASVAPSSAGSTAFEAVEKYHARERSKILELSRFEKIAIWGMATKGVMLSLMLGQGTVLGGIDGNPKKQGKFAAGSGVAIHSPTWSVILPDNTVTLVMNPNYLGEISETIRDLKAKVKLISI